MRNKWLKTGIYEVAEFEQFYKNDKPLTVIYL
jgi:hypothetical protein